MEVAEPHLGGQMQCNEHKKIVKNDLERQFASPVCAIGKLVTDFRQTQRLWPELLRRFGIKVNQNFVATGVKIDIINHFKYFAAQREEA